MVSVPYRICGPIYVSSFGMESRLSKPHSITVLREKKKNYNCRLNSLILQVRKLRLKKLWHSVWANQVAGKESTCQCRRRRFNPWVRKIPWRRKWQTHSSILAWKIPWTEEPSGLQCMALQSQMGLSKRTHANLSQTSSPSYASRLVGTQFK